MSMRLLLPRAGLYDWISTELVVKKSDEHAMHPGYAKTRILVDMHLEAPRENTLTLSVGRRIVRGG